MTSLKNYIKKNILLILVLSVTFIIFELFLMKILVGEFLFYTGKPTMVIDGAAYEVNESFSAYQSEDDFSSIIGKHFNYPKLFVTHISDEFFIKLLEVESITPMNSDKCLFVLWGLSPAWRDTETKLIFKWLYNEDEKGIADESRDALEVYSEFGCSLAKRID